MASSLASLEAAGSPVKPGSSVIHLCISVKRTVRGSVSGCLSARPMAMSSRLSQPKVGGMLAPGKCFQFSVVSFQLRENRNDFVILCVVLSLCASKAIQSSEFASFLLDANTEH